MTNISTTPVSFNFRGDFVAIVNGLRYSGFKCSKHEHTADPAPDSYAVFLRPKILRSMVECAANTIPVRGICPPSVCGFEHLATFSKEVNSKYHTGAYHA